MSREETPRGPVDLECAALSAGPGGLLPKWRRALPELLRAFDYAASIRIEAWQFAVGIGELRRAGLSDSDCRWLVGTGFLEHAHEVTLVEDASRRFRRVHNLAFFERSCFVLTGAGVAFARASLTWIESPVAAPPLISVAVDRPAHARELLPSWDADLHELRLGSQLVKQFRWMAANQEMVLAAFEEDGWPARIDDPLPPQPDQDSKRRLHDTIKCLNRHQTHRLVRFRGDGTGEGVLWNLVDPVDRLASSRPVG